MEDKESMINEFQAISGADKERATFFLESSKWDLQTALSSFFEEPDAEPEQASGQPKPTISKDIGKDDDLMDSDSEDEGQAFYAGGSEHSGQQVIGPGKKSDMVSKIFKSAKEHGAEVVESDGKNKTKKMSFSGTGYKLGQTETDHKAVPSTSNASKESRNVDLKLYKPGFTVDDGPLREYGDPANRQFLNAVVKGQIPDELVKQSQGTVYINMIDNRHDDYVPPKPKIQAFSGVGHALGSVVPPVTGQVRNTGTAGGAVGDTKLPQSPMADEEEAKSQLNLSTSDPVTNIQLRLPDGSRLVAQFNHTHTVGNIREYVRTARPLLPPNLAIMTTFPHAELQNDEATIVEAKILNSALVIKDKGR